MQLAHLKPGLALTGLEPDLVCTAVAVVPIAAGAVQVVYKLPDGTLKERLLGNEEDFQLFLSLLDSDRFYGKFRDGVHKVDVTDLMRRMVKEELVKFDGTPLFPERKAYTVNYKLSSAEARLYEAVTKYVQTEMGKADQLGGSRKGSVGFALTTLQRRLASSPEAIYQSLRRRKERLGERLRAEKLGDRGRQLLAETVNEVPEDDDDLNADELETLEEKLVDQATAAKTIAELEGEILILKDLEAQAKAVVASGQDRKWDELSKPARRPPEGTPGDAAGAERHPGSPRRSACRAGRPAPQAPGRRPGVERRRRRGPQADRDAGHAGGHERREGQGHLVVDGSAEKCGWDVSSYPPAGSKPKHVEVKGADTITVTRNEILYAFNQGDKFVLAIVFVNPDDSTEGPYYLANPFQREPD